MGVSHGMTYIFHNHHFQVFQPKGHTATTSQIKLQIKAWEKCETETTTKGINGLLILQKRWKADKTVLLCLFWTWCSLHAAHWGEKHMKQQDWPIQWGRRGKQPCSRMNETEWWCPLLHYQHICFWIGSTNSDSSQTGVKGGPWKPSCCISADKPVSLAFFTY